MGPPGKCGNPNDPNLTQDGRFSSIPKGFMATSGPRYGRVISSFEQASRSQKGAEPPFLGGHHGRTEFWDPVG